jgi:serine/threonine protein kinase/cytochrome c-type biogenesis protein CcmH/NrfG
VLVGEYGVMAGVQNQTIQIFYCYAPQDVSLRNELNIHLSPLRKLRQITAWLDTDIQAGKDWAQEIETHFATANILLLLVSPDFFASDYHYDFQMQIALERHKAGQAQIIPIIARPVVWEDTPLGQLRSLILPRTQKPITSWSDRDEAWRDVILGIRDVIRPLLPTQILSAKESRTLDQLGSKVPPSDISPLDEEHDITAKSFAILPLPIGTILNKRFKIVSVLGAGGMGTVYKVEQVGRPGYYRAVKELLINPNTSEEARKSAIERFDKEIDILFNLEHPRIPSLILSFQERGNYYFVMEYVPGRSLDMILEDNHAPLEEDRVIRWMMMACEAVTYVHTRTPPIILRDLKPSNIMVTSNDDVSLIDFGIARRFDTNKRTNTENMGTISYASPEHLGAIAAPGQRRSPQNPGKLVQTDARSDIYSLGATTYHLLTNQEPEPIETPAVGSILAKNPLLRTVQINGRRISPVEQVIIKAMQQEPAQRFQNAEAMRTALRHCLPNQIQAVPTVIQIPAISPNVAIVVPEAAAGIVCPKCGYRNRPGAKFCKRDGQPLVQGAITVPPQIKTPTAEKLGAPTPFRARPINAGVTTNNNSQVAYRLGLQFLNNGQYAQAINQLKLAQVSAMPTYDVQYNLGRAYRQYGQTLKGKGKNLFTEQMKMAAEHFEKAITTRPDAIDALFQLGMTYNDLQLYEKATTAFTNAWNYSPGDSAIYYQLGNTASNRGLNRDAEEYYLEGLKVNPDHALIWIALGSLYLRVNKTRDAIRVLRQATQRVPEAWEGWFELGRAHMKAREWKVALSVLEQARQWNPDASMIYSAISTCYLQTNNKAEARRMVREALQRDPNNPEAQRLQNQL